MPASRSIRRGLGRPGPLLIDGIAALVASGLMAWPVLSAGHLLAGIRVVAAGEALLAPSVTRQLSSEFVRRPASDRPPPATLDALTGREREVLTLVARGWSNAEIAGRLCLSPATAKTHVGRLLTKLQARDRTQLVVIAYQTGLVTPSGP